MDDGLREEAGPVMAAVRGSVDLKEDGGAADGVVLGVAMRLEVGLGFGVVVVVFAAEVGIPDFGFPLGVDETVVF